MKKTLITISLLLLSLVVFSQSNIEDKLKNDRYIELNVSRVGFGNTFNYIFNVNYSNAGKFKNLYYEDSSYILTDKRIPYQFDDKISVLNYFYTIDFTITNVVINPTNPNEFLYTLEKKNNSNLEIQLD